MRVIMRVRSRVEVEDEDEHVSITTRLHQIKYEYLQTIRPAVNIVLVTKITLNNQMLLNLNRPTST